MAETDGCQWMTNPSKIDTADTKQILDEKFNHLKSEFFWKYSVSTAEHERARHENSGYLGTRLGTGKKLPEKPGFLQCNVTF